MSKAVFIQSRHARYADRPGELYQFPSARYLTVAARAVGDWVIFYEGRRGGSRGYYAVQKVDRLVPDPTEPGCHLAIMDQASLLGFESSVAYADPDGAPYERALAGPDGLTQGGGNNTAAIRTITDSEFARIVSIGLTPAEPPEALPRDGPRSGVQESLLGLAETSPAFLHAEPLLTDRTRVLTDRALRDQSFARQVKIAYQARCAMSGLALRNGGGRPEVEAAHIRPVASRGPDVVQNGMALSGTLHWMFDRGLLAVDQDNSILIAKGSIADEVGARLLTGDRRLMVPEQAEFQPHPAYLAWHRDNLFKG